MMLTRRHSRRLRTLALLPAALLALTACDGDSGVAGVPLSTTGSVPPAPPTSPPTPTPIPVSTSGPSTPPATSTPFRAKRPGPALRSWVTLVLQAKYKEACLATEQVVTGDQDPASCTSPTVVKGLTALHDGWVKQGVEIPPKSKVTVAPLKPREDSVMVSDTAVKVGNRTLHDLLTDGDPNAPGLVSFVLHKSDGYWYLSAWSAT